MIMCFLNNLKNELDFLLTSTRVMDSGKLSLGQVRILVVAAGWESGRGYRKDIAHRPGLLTKPAAQTFNHDRDRHYLLRNYSFSTDKYVL